MFGTEVSEAMNDYLSKLIKLMPPLAGQRHTQVDWAILENCLGLTYPCSFKDFIGIYGSAHWFDMVLPIYAMPKCPSDVESFRQDIADRLNCLRGNQYDENYKELHLPLYPAPGGLFPFMNDIDGPLYLWLTADSDPEKWPIYCWMRGRIQVLTNMTIADMLLGFMQGSPEMVALWGDIRSLEHERIGIVDCCED